MEVRFDRTPPEPMWTVYVAQPGSGTPWYLPKRMAATPRLAMHVVADLLFSNRQDERWRWKDAKQTSPYKLLEATLRYGVTAKQARFSVSECDELIYREHLLDEDGFNRYRRRTYGDGRMYASDEIADRKRKEATSDD